MSCCCPHSRSASRVFGSQARRYRRRFERKGLEASQKQLFQQLQQAGFSGRSIIEIGCGVGFFHQSMLEAGAQRALGIDLAEPMLDEARKEAKRRGLQDRTVYQSGDFMQMHDTDQFDVGVLDKVLCCYPDAPGLLTKTANGCDYGIGFTLPKNRWYTRLGAGLGALFMKVIRSDFRPYVHDPEALDRLLMELGFRRKSEDSTWLWLSRVYLRQPA